MTSTELHASVYRELLRAVAAGASYSEVAELAARHAMAAMDADGASVTRLSRDELVYAAALGSISGVVGRRLRVSDSFSGSVVRSGKAVRFDPGSAAENTRARARGDKIRSGIIAPVMAGTTVLGTFGVASNKTDHFDAEDEAVIDELAKFLSITLQTVADRNRADEAEQFATLGRLAAGLAHEVNNPLTWVSGGLTELRDVLSGGDGRDPMIVLDEVRDGIDRVAGFVREIREIARRDDAGPREIIDPVDELFEGAAHVNARLEHATIEVDIPDDLGTVSVPPGRLRQVLISLLHNSADATATLESPNIVVAARADHAKLYVRVIDNGPGVPESIATRIFEPFFTTKPRAMGMGLAQAARFCRDIGAQLRLVPRDDGCEFEVTLPIAGK